MLIVKGNRSHNTAAFTTPYNFCQKKCCHSRLNDGVIMISKRKWELLQEELYLQRTGTWAYVSDLMDRLQLTRQKN
ncbi:hypothetical protein N8B53_13370 [Enterococcus faecium]